MPKRLPVIRYRAVCRNLLAMGLGAWCACGAVADDVTPAMKRTNNRSPLYQVAPDDIDFFMNYTGFVCTNAVTGAGTRSLTAGIEPKMAEMIAAARTHIILSVFLFDSFYAEGPPDRDVVGPIVRQFLAKRKQVPDIRIAVILDPSHKAYGQRLSPAERVFREHGIDVFYSDLIVGLKRTSLLGVREGLGHINRGINVLTFRTWSRLWSGVFSRAKLPVRFDGDLVSLESAYNAALLKANHRKLLVTDTGGRAFEALVSSANPHNASAFHVNSAVSVRGEPAAYLYRMLREDMVQAARLGPLHAHWNDRGDRAYREQYFETHFPENPLPSAPAAAPGSPAAPVSVRVVSEGTIPGEVIRMLRAVQPDDMVRIQMFYFSFQPVVDAVLAASTVSRHPVRLLLDANKDSFNKEKDGTPNRQVARYLLREAGRRGGRIEVRWYATHGEQNHAKTMTITNAKDGKYQLTTGSCNWTGRNMDGGNMECNVMVDGSRKAVDAFNNLFDRFWTNGDGRQYSLDYEAYRDAAPDWKWRKGEKPFYWSTF